MTLAWWFESLWRGAVVAVSGLVLWLVIALLIAAWRWRMFAYRSVRDRVWLRLPFAQRRTIRHWEDTQQWYRHGRAEWARYKLRLIDTISHGRRERYRVLVGYLEPLAGEESRSAAS